MTLAQYSRTIANNILGKIHAKGWNAYLSDNAREQGEEEIRKGSAKMLELEQRYVMLPRIEEDKDFEKVIAALERLAVKLNRETPTILIRGERFPWTGFRLNTTWVKVNTNVGHCVNYEQFVGALDSIVQADDSS